MTLPAVTAAVPRRSAIGRLLETSVAAAVNGLRPASASLGRGNATLVLFGQVRTSKWQDPDSLKLVSQRWQVAVADQRAGQLEQAEMDVAKPLIANA